ncbi:anhydro-N-acetylmuramic acid kinase [Chitinophaga oryzae]|uniref:Anhydro-N-acetylmuramic acid kinase n=1 Tax=Chitinophaga oryzae TaxID=2725414 RepID=A0AAE7DA65_9BACT|nr:anhydro-N-acetylmuramic acid kinase [Chitinophaga oryzae]QJB33994.1 anhydro-N-acetylmuramic acid kinase [Chitinophaga oryzae]QJB40522.1 anhydro-N-acetylmuramic acid kinase [Chitinophaga oryzae]
MVYNVIGTMSGSSLDGLDIVFAELTEIRGQWTYVIKASESLPYEPEWVEKLAAATTLPAKEYLLLHTAYGHYAGQRILSFIERNELDHKVHFIASHGHTTFHLPGQQMTAQLGDGAAMAAVTRLPVITDLRAVDVALGGQGAPIVPIGEKYLLGGYQFWLNLGGIANISAQLPDGFAAFDICPANRVLNELALQLNKPYDEGGALAAGGVTDTGLLAQLNALPYYRQPWPKSLANDFGTDTVLPMVNGLRISVQGKLRTYTEHIAAQIAQAAGQLKATMPEGPAKLLVTGGGAFNTFLVETIRQQLTPLGIDVEVPDELTVAFKEALVMALIGALRWRQEVNVLSSVTGAKQDSINGALWISQ